MRRVLLPALALLLIIVSCKDRKEEQLIAVGGKSYGGEFRFMSSEKVKNLFPLGSSDVYSQRITSQIFESLLKLDISSMKVVPSLAESYQVSNDGKTYTFNIRKGVHFQDDECFDGEGRELTAEDAKFALDVACSGLKMNKMSYLLVNRISGANEFYNKSVSDLPDGGVSGIQVVDKHTLKISLIEPFSDFDKVLTHTNLGIFPKEAYEMYGKDLNQHPVGTGPFKLEKMDAKGITLERNANYWRKDELGNRLPFLDKVVMTYSNNKKAELLAFRKKQVDIVLEIPVEEIENILGTLRDAQQGKNVKHRVDSRPSMSINYVAFNCESAEFKDVAVRKAFNLAVNREDIVDHWLLGEGWPALHGFVPNMEGYPTDEVKGFDYNPEQARKLLAQAGYPEGKGFPVLDFYVNAMNGSAAHKMCLGIAHQLKVNLGIQLKIKLCSLEERSKAIASGKAKIWRSGWVADYPDAENFLSLFYSGNLKEEPTDINTFRFRNKNYDQALEAALKERDEVKRNQLYVRCDQLLVTEAAVMPVMTDDFMVMINARVRDFQTNSMENLDFSLIFIKEPRN